MERCDETILTRLMAEGIVRLENGEYVGTAADGVVVSFGCEGNEYGVCVYLTAHPTPDTW